MTAYKLVVLSNAVAGKDDEFNDWYDNIHLGDVLRVKGFTAASRYKLGAGFEGPHKYMAIYEMETDDPGKVLADMQSRAGTPDLVISPTLDAAGVAMTLFESIGPRQVAKG